MKWEHVGCAIITGASSGIGAEFATRLAQQGFNLLLIARRKDRLHDLASKLKSTNGIEADILVADLASIEGITQVCASIQNYPDIDVLINNAGFGTVGLFHELDLNSQIQMQFVHNTAPFILTKAILPLMITRNRGVLIYTSSLGALVPTPANGLYPSTKAFLISFAENLAIELHKTEIRVQALCPGFTHTEFHDKGEAQLAKTSIPAKMWQNPDQVVTESLIGAYKRKKIVIPGRNNRFLIHAIPRFLRNKIILNTYRVMGKKREKANQ